MKKKPIVIIPGTQGTKLNSSNEVDFKVVFSGIKKFFSNIHSLTLQKDGVSDFKKEIVIERADVENLAYSEIVNYLRALGYSVYIFGYDWRKSSAHTALDLKRYVDKLSKKLGEDSFNYVTHSMGGLVLSAYLKLLSTEDIKRVIHKIVFTTPPFLGSLEAVFNLVIGKSRLFNSSDDFRKVGRTFPGIYELLPVFKKAYVLKADHKVNFYDYSSYWQQRKNEQGNDLLIHRLRELEKVRNQNDFVFDLSTLEPEVRKKIIVLAGGGENTKTKLRIDEDVDGFKFLFDFERYGEKKEGGDGTVPLQSSTAFKKAIDTYVIDTTWFEKRIDSKFIADDWHAFFLNNSRVQNIIKRFLDPDFVANENWYQSIGKNKIEKL